MAPAVGDLNLAEHTNYLSLSLLSWANKLLPSFSEIMEKSLQIEHLLLIKHMQRYFSRYPLIKLKLSFTSFLVSQLLQRPTIFFSFPYLSVVKEGQGSNVLGEEPESIEDIIFPFIPLTSKVHFGLIFEMGEQLFEITQPGLSASKPSTCRGPSLLALLSSELRRERFAALRVYGKADLGALGRVT